MRVGGSRRPKQSAAILPGVAASLLWKCARTVEMHEVMSAVSLRGVRVKNAFTWPLSSPPPRALQGTSVTSATVPNGSRR